MKTIDVSQKVMNSIIRLEKGRTRRWLLWFGITILVLLIAVIVLLIQSFQIASDRKVWDLLTLFLQDPEIISEYWKDTLWIFWMELPQWTLKTCIVLIGILCAVFLFTRHKRKVLQSKLKQLEKYR